MNMYLMGFNSGCKGDSMPDIRTAHLFHGSKRGLNGSISPYMSRTECDFGRGFYTGDQEDQQLGLIAKWDTGVMYELSATLSDLEVLEFDE